MEAAFIGILLVFIIFVISLASGSRPETYSKKKERLRQQRSNKDWWDWSGEEAIQGRPIIETQRDKAWTLQQTRRENEEAQKTAHALTGAEVAGILKHKRTLD